jgi:hypothetical protein
MVFQLPDAKKCVAFLFSSHPSSKGEPEPLGTCFFAEVTGVAGGSGLNYLITAKHVLQDLRQAGKAFVRLNDPNGGVSYREIALDEQDWLCNVVDEAVDVAIFPLPWILGAPDYEIGFVNLDVNLSGEPVPWTPREAEDVAFMGLMFNFVGKKRNLLALRVGTIALITDEPIQGLFGGPSKYHIIDVQAYPGNSGAPVWLVSAQMFFLLGVLSAGYPTKAQLIQTKESSWRSEQYYNLGMSLVTPVEKVLEIVKPHIKKQVSPSEGSLL